MPGKQVKQIARLPLVRHPFSVQALARADLAHSAPYCHEDPGVLGFVVHSPRVQDLL